MNTEVYLILKETDMNARKDLQTSLSQEILDKLLENKYIEPKYYLEAKKSLEALKCLIYNNSKIIEDYEAKITSEELFNIETSIIANHLGYTNWNEWLNEYYKINLKDKKSELSNIDLTNEIAKDLGYDNWHAFLNNYPYPIPKENKIFEDMVNN